MTNFTHTDKRAKEDVGSADIQRKGVPDSQALQEIIDILKEPFQTTCETCKGMGIVRNGDECPDCDGKGKVLEKIFK